LILKDFGVHKKIPGGYRVQLLCWGERLKVCSVAV